MNLEDPVSKQQFTKDVIKLVKAWEKETLWLTGRRRTMLKDFNKFVQEKVK